MRYIIIFYRLIYILVIYQNFFFASADLNISEESLITLTVDDFDKISDILNPSKGDFKNRNFENHDKVFLKKIEIIFNIITGKFTITRYVENKKLLWQIDNKKYLNFKIVGINDEGFFTLFNEMSQYYCSEENKIARDCINKKIIESKIKLYIDLEPILDQKRAQEILKKNNIDSVNNPISHLHDILSNNSINIFNLDNFFNDIDDTKIKKILLDIYYYFIPELYLLINKQNITIDDFNKDLLTIFDFFLSSAADFIDKNKQKNIYEKMIKKLFDNDDSENKMIRVTLYNDIILRLFSLDELEIVFDKNRHYVALPLCMKIFQHDQREQYIKALQEVWKKFLELYNKKKLSKYDNEILFFNNLKQKEYFKKYLTVCDFNDEYINEKIIEYIKNNNKYCMLYELDQECFIAFLKKRKNILIKEKKDVQIKETEYILVGFVNDIIKKSIAESSLENYRDKLNCLENNIEAPVLLNIKNSIAKKFLLRDVSNKTLIDIVGVILEFSFKNKIKNGDVVDYKKLSDYYRIEYQILYLCNLHYSPDSKNNTVLTEKDAQSFCVVNSVDLDAKIFNGQEFCEFFSKLDTLYGIKKLSKDHTKIKNIFLFNLFRFDLKEKFIIWYRYFKIDPEVIIDVVDQMKEIHKDGLFLNNIIASILLCQEIDNKDKLKIIFLNDDGNKIQNYIAQLKLSEEDLVYSQVLYINYYLKSSGDEMVIPDNVLDRQSLLHYYCQEFDFITDNIKDIIFEGVKDILNNQSVDKKDLYDCIWENIIGHEDGARYKASYSEGTIIAEQNSIVDRENQLLEGNHKRVHENDRGIRKQKKIIECLIKNIINLVCDMGDITLKNFINLLKLNKEKKYFDCCSVLCLKNKDRSKLEKLLKCFFDDCSKFSNDECKNFVYFLLSNIPQDYKDYIFCVVDCLIKSNMYSILDDVLKEDVFLTIDSFLLYYDAKKFKKHIDKFAEMKFLWKYLVEKIINDKNSLTKKTRQFFYILLDRKIEKDKLNDDEEKKIYYWLFNCFLDSLEKRNNQSCSDLDSDSDKLVLDFCYKRLDKITECILSCQEIDNKNKLKIIFLNQDDNKIQNYIAQLKLSEEDLVDSEVRYINKYQYYAVECIPDSFLVLNRKSLLYYYCQEFKFITDNIKDIIFEGVKDIKKDQVIDKKNLYDSIWNNIISHKDCEKYKASYSEGAIIAEPNSIFLDRENEVLEGNHKRVHQNNRDIAKEKNIIECLIKNIINLVCDMGDITLKNFINLLELKKGKEYFDCCFVLCLKNKDRSKLEKLLKCFFDDCSKFSNDECKNFVSFLLSNIPKENANRICFVIDGLMNFNMYSILDDVLKEDVFLTIDSFLLYYDTEEFKKHIDKFAEMKFLWKYLVEKIEDPLNEKAQHFFYILLDRKIEKDKLNDDEEKKIYYWLFNYFLDSLEKKNNPSCSDLDSGCDKLVLDFCYKRLDKITECILSCQEIDNKNKLKIIFLNKDDNKIESYIAQLELSGEDLVDSEVRCINKYQYYAVECIPDSFLVLNRKSLLYYYCQEFKFITDNIKDIIFEGVKDILNNQSVDKKDLYDCIWENIIGHEDGAKYKESYSEGAIIAEPNDINSAVNKENEIVKGNHKRIHENNRVIGKQKKIIECLINNIINLVCDMGDITLKHFINLLKLKRKGQSYFDCCSVLCLKKEYKNDIESLLEVFFDCSCQFGNDYCKNFVSFLLSRIPTSDFRVVNCLMNSKMYLLLDDILKEDVFLTIDYFLRYCNVEEFKLYIDKFVEMEFLWKYLVERIKDKDSLNEKAQSIFYILLDRKIEQNKLNANEEQEIYSWLFNCLVSLEKKNNELCGDVLYNQRKSFLNIWYNTMKKNKKELTDKEKKNLLNDLCIDFRSFLLVDKKFTLMTDDSLKKIVFIFLSLSKSNNIDEIEKTTALFIDQLITLKFDHFNTILKENTEILNFLLKKYDLKKLESKVDYFETMDFLWKFLLAKIKHPDSTLKEKESFYLLFEIKLKFDIKYNTQNCFYDIKNANLDYSFLNINNVDDGLKNYLCEEFCTNLKNKVDYSLVMDFLWKSLLIKIENPNIRQEEKELFYLLFEKKMKCDMQYKDRKYFNDIVNAKLDYSFLNTNEFNKFDNSLKNYLCKEFCIQLKNNQSLTTKETNFVLQQLSRNIEGDSYNQLETEYSNYCNYDKGKMLVLSKTQKSNISLFLDIFYHRIKTDRDYRPFEIVNDLVSGMEKCINNYNDFFKYCFFNSVLSVENILRPVNDSRKCFGDKYRFMKALELYKMYMCIFILFIKTNKFDFSEFNFRIPIFQYIQEGYQYLPDKDQMLFIGCFNRFLFEEADTINVDFDNEFKDRDECYFAYFKIWTALSFCSDIIVDVDKLTIGNVIKFVYINKRLFYSDIVNLIELLFLKLKLNGGSSFANSFMVPFLRPDSLEKKKDLFKQKIFYFASNKMLTKYSFLPYDLLQDICIKDDEKYDWGLTYNDLTVLFDRDDYSDLFIDDANYTDELRYAKMTSNVKLFLENISENISKWNDDNFLLNRIQSKKFVFLSLGSILFGYKFKEKGRHEKFIALLNRICLDNKVTLTKKEFLSNILIEGGNKYKDGISPILASHCDKYKYMLSFQNCYSNESKLADIKNIDDMTNKIQSKKKKLYDENDYVSLEVELNHIYDKDFFVKFLDFLFVVEEKDRKEIKNYYQKNQLYNLLKLDLNNDFYYSDICRYLLIGAFDCKGFLVFNEMLKKFICDEVGTVSKKLLAAITKKYQSLLRLSNLSNDHRESIYHILFIIHANRDYNQQLFLEYQKKNEKEIAEEDLIWKCRSLVTLSGIALVGSGIALRMGSEKQLKSNVSWFFNEINSLGSKIKKIESKKFWAGVAVLGTSVLLCNKYAIPYLIKKKQTIKSNESLVL